MVPRTYWIEKIEAAWKRRSLIWLAGVRRAGKTCLCQSLEEIEYFDCELPRVRRMLEDPQAFLQSVEGKRIVLDEIHRLDNPAELLKIAADHYPTTKVIATGSSTLGASKKFRDTLTGRKTKIHLPPMLQHEAAEFDGRDLEYRLLHGGLPPFFLEERPLESDYQEWLSSYWAKDVQELYQLDKHHSFMKLTELMLAQSGGIFEATRFAAPCEVSRPTIGHYLAVLEATYVAYIIRPFSTNARTEIVSAPKVYGFDTGFVCYVKGWSQLRPDDLGDLWEHFVLNELNGKLQGLRPHYWRDKRGHEIDFVFPGSGNRQPITIECKWNGAKFDATNLRAFRRRYREGLNFVVAPDIDRSYDRHEGELIISFVSLETLIDRITRLTH